MAYISIEYISIDGVYRKNNVRFVFSEPEHP